MLLIYILIALFIAWIWVDYFRLIDIYQANKLFFVALTFALGCSSVFIVTGLHTYFPELFLLRLNGNMLNDFMYFTLQVGVLEEIAKLIPFLIIYGFFRKEFTEPIDYIAFIAISALGFSAVENMMYFDNYGPTLINGRAILCSVGHMFDTVLIAYGIILVKFHPRHNSLFYIPLFFLLAAFSHGFYDFWLSYDGGWIVTILYFFITISWFGTIMNNALNNSTHFNYKRVIDPTKVSLRLLSYYGVVFIFEFVILIVHEDVMYAIVDLVGSMLTVGFIVVITCIRLSKFKLIQNRWKPFQVEVPFTTQVNDPLGMKSSYFKLQVRGDANDEVVIAPFYLEYCTIYPVSQNRTYIHSPRLAFVAKIGFLQNDEVYYQLDIYEGDKNSPFESVVLKPKNTGETMVNDKYPIIATFDIRHLENWDNPKHTVKDFKFREWGYLVPLKK